MELLLRAYDYICSSDVVSLEVLLNKNTDTPVSAIEFENFTQMFAQKEKSLISGSINIHGMGSSGIAKVNLTSLACLYLTAIIEMPIVKTGSRKNSGIMGSTDFFEKLGYMDIIDKKGIFETYGFAYFDYLELSPWKAYKNILCKNRDIADILGKYHFFEYKISTLGLGISSWELYDRFVLQKHYPAPDRIFTYSSQVNGMAFDEISPSGFEYPDKMLTTQEITKLNYDLLYGNDMESYWYNALRESVAIFAMELKAVTDVKHGEESFDKVYRDKIVMDMIKKITHS